VSAMTMALVITLRASAEIAGLDTDWTLT